MTSYEAFDADFECTILEEGTPKLRAEFPPEQVGKLPKAGM